MTIEMGELDPSWSHFIAIAVPGFMIAGMIFFIFRTYHLYRMIADTPTSKIRSAPQGLVELIGTAKPWKAQHVNAPFSGLSCLWFSASIAEYHPGDKDNNGRWDTIWSDRSATPFELVDDTGTCVIFPGGAEFVTATERMVYRNQRAITAAEMLNEDNSFNQKYRFTEAIVTDDEPLYALGEFKTVTGDTFNRLAPAIKNEEFETVPTATGLESVHTMSKPGYARQPYILSTDGEKKLIQHYKNTIVFLSIGIFIVAGFGVVMFLGT